MKKKISLKRHNFTLKLKIGKTNTLVLRAKEMKPFSLFRRSSGERIAIRSKKLWKQVPIIDDVN